MLSKVRKGDKIVAKVRHDGVKAGTEGVVVGVYSGTFYAVNYPGIPGVCYTPDTHSNATTGPGAAPTPATAPGGTGPPATPPVAATAEPTDRVGAWGRLMEMVSR